MPQAVGAGQTLAVSWVSERLSLDDATRRGIVSALEDCLLAVTASSVAWGLEMHHDGTRHVDVSVLPSATGGRGDVWEYDLTEDGPRLAGVFRSGEAVEVPTALAGLGTPLLAAHLTGRDGQVRMLFPVADSTALVNMMTTLARQGPARLPVERLAAAAPLITDGTTLRVGIEYLPDRDTIGDRLGIEVVLDPRVFAMQEVLLGLGVASEDIDDMQELADRLPFACERARRIEGLPVLDATIDAVGLSHISVVWTGSHARVKSYLMVTSGPASDAESLLESAAIRMSQAWPDRLEWAARQLPLTSPPDETAIEAWQVAVDPGGTGLFERRLDLGSLTQAQALVALSSVAGIRRADPDWLPYLRDFRRSCQNPGTGTPLDHAEDFPASAAAVPFAHVLWPGIVDAWRSFAAAHVALVSGLTPAAVDDLRLALLSRIGEVLGPTLLSEFTSTQTFGQRMLQRVTAEPVDPPRAEYARTCQRLASGGLDRVLLEHPVLPSLVGTVIRQWRESATEMLARVQRHRQDLHRDLGVDPHSHITRAALSAGDGHNDGRAVAVLSFGATRVVYKPRDCRMEYLWAQIVNLVNSQLDDAGLRAPRMIVGDDATGANYGFAEYIEHRAAVSDDELSRFYINAGRTLAVVYALSATDCHFENLVAHGDQLVLVDAEALFETRSARMQQAEPDAVDGSGPVTVLQTGMLPGWLWMEGERAAMDISALGCQAGGGRRTTVRGWRSTNTDAMTRGVTSLTVPHPVSLPTPPGVTPDLPTHVHEVADGFLAGYRAVMAARDTGLLQLLDGSRHLYRRLIQRPTYVYAALLSQNREPDALRSVTARGLVLEKLTRAYLVDEVERLWPLLRAEQAAMSRLDVPLFEAALDGSRTRGCGVEVADWPGVDTMAVVRERIARLTESDMRWQETLIRASFAAHAFEGTADLPVVQPATADVVTTLTDLHDRCASRITGNAVPVADAVTWMTLGPLPDGQKANVQPIGSGLYDGALGIAVFLHEAGAHDMASAATRPLLLQLDPDEPARARRQLLAVGLGFSGAGGYLRGIRLLEAQGYVEPAAADRAVSAVVRACALPSIRGDRRLDLMGGVAGLIGPLVDEVQGERLDATDHAHARAVIEAAADRLVSTQTADGGWCTLPGSGPLTGLAHGASGIAVALVRAAMATGSAGFVEAAARGLAFEQGCFDAEAGNWRDLRASARSGFMLGWCAGAPGIALARMALLDLLPEHHMSPEWRADLEVAAATTATLGMLARDHICCGNLGRAAVLTHLGRSAGRRDWVDAGMAITDAVAARAGAGLPVDFLGSEAGADPSNPHAMDLLAVPGLMTGLAGAGLVLGSSDAWRTLLLP